MTIRKFIGKYFFKCYSCGWYGLKKYSKELPGYWYPKTKHRFHSWCDNTKNIIECQTVDADCNDCLFFKREKTEAKGIATGTCMKYNNQTTAYPNFCSNHPCFVHRKS